MGRCILPPAVRFIVLDLRSTVQNLHPGTGRYRPNRFAGIGCASTGCYKVSLPI
jgi:hypothetical protein